MPFDGELRLPDMNRITLAGVLVRDPESRVLPNGMNVCKFTVAYNYKWRGKDGEMKEESAFVECQAWAKTAEYVGETLHKGHPVLVEGKLKMDSWKDKATGANRSKLYINCDRVQCMLWKGNTRGKKQETKQESNWTEPLGSDETEGTDQEISF